MAVLTQPVGISRSNSTIELAAEANSAVESIADLRAQWLKLWVVS